MAWIESHQSLLTHRKTGRLARALGIPKVHAVGHLHAFWWWCLDNAPNGELVDSIPAEIADAACWDGDPELFMQAMALAGFLDVHGDADLIVVHDWMDYAGKLIKAREHEASMKRRNRDLYDDVGLTRAVRLRDGDGCRYCGKTVNWHDRKGRLGGTYDHVDPTGGNHYENIVVACRACNAGKSNRTPEQAGYKLIPVGSPADPGRKPTGNLPGSAHEPTITVPNPTVPNRTKENNPLTPLGGNQALPTADVFAWAPTADKHHKPLPDTAITLAKVAEWRQTHPMIDVEAEVRKCIQWMRDDAKRIGSRPVARIGNWLNNARPSAMATVNGAPIDPVDALLSPEEMAALLKVKAQAAARHVSN